MTQTEKNKIKLTRLTLLLETVMTYGDLSKVSNTNNVDTLINELEVQKKEIDEKMKKGKLK